MTVVFSFEGALDFIRPRRDLEHTKIISPAYNFYFCETKIIAKLNTCLAYLNVTLIFMALMRTLQNSEDK